MTTRLNYVTDDDEEAFIEVSRAFDRELVAAAMSGTTADEALVNILENQVEFTGADR